jgi:heterodisulfide reductase subunit A-like polyferredoxin
MLTPNRPLSSWFSYTKRLAMVVKTSSAEFYLLRDSDELVVKTGKSPICNFEAKKRILIIGGGVTGLTVSGIMSSDREGLTTDV